MLADPQQDSSLLEFMYACPVGLLEIDHLGTIVMVNPHAMKHLLPIAAETRRDMSNLFDALEDCAPELRNLVQHFEPTRGMVCENHRIVVDLRRKRSEDRKIIATTIVKMKPDRLIVTLSDITTQVEQEHRLKLADTWFSSLLDSVNDYAVLAVDPAGIIDTVNDAYARQTGRALTEVKGQSLIALLDIEPAPGAPTLADQFRHARCDGWSLDEGWQRRKDGQRYWCQRLIVARVGDDGLTIEGFTVVLRDVIHETAEAGDLRRMLTQDHLTGAANRAHFLKRFERAHGLWLQNQHPLSLILVDIDHFKSINDRFGHPFGDQVLRTLSQACMTTLPPGNLFARLGGEEFAALLPNTPLDEAMQVAERLRFAIASERLETSGVAVRVTASFGCVTIADRTTTIDDLIRTADERLYKAKQSGRNQVCGPPDVELARGLSGGVILEGVDDHAAA